MFAETNHLRSQLFDRLPDSKFAKPQLAPVEAVETDLKHAMRQALEHPQHYPPLSSSVFAGDKIAILLQSGLPHVKDVLVSLLEQLAICGIDLADVLVVISESTARKLGLTREQIRQNTEVQENAESPIFESSIDGHLIRFQIHNADNDAAVAYLAANSAGDPIYVNRQLVDADVVLPVGCPSSGDTQQQVDCLYPEFGSAAIKARFQKGEGSFLSRDEEIELANDTLGTFFSIQIVSGPGENIHKVICGARRDAVQLARAETNRLWEFDWPENVDLAVATIETVADEQTWEDFAHAVIAASRVSVADGPIVVWSEISEKPNRRIRKACQSQFEDGINTKLSKELQHMASILKERPVFLRSELSRSEIEELGIGFIESAEDVNRISDAHQTGLLLRDAHKCRVRPRSNVDA